MTQAEHLRGDEFRVDGETVRANSLTQAQQRAEDARSRARAAIDEARRYDAVAEWWGASGYPTGMVWRVTWGDWAIEVDDPEGAELTRGGISRVNPNVTVTGPYAREETRR